MRWLEVLIWPEQTERRRRLHDAITIAKSAPALLVPGDLNQDLATLAAKGAAHGAPCTHTKSRTSPTTGPYVCLP